jgi:diphthine synthase
MSRGLHTLLLLDPPVLGKNGLTISQAINKILNVHPSLANKIVVGAARVGAPTQEVKAGRMQVLEKHDFGSPPHTLVFVGRLHFMEAEALQAFCGATQTDLEDLI